MKALNTCQEIIRLVQNLSFETERCLEKETWTKMIKRKNRQYDSKHYQLRSLQLTTNTKSTEGQTTHDGNKV